MSQVPKIPTLYRSANRDWATVTGGLYLVTDVSRQHPLQWAWGQRMLEATLDSRNLVRAFQKIGEEIKNSWVRSLQMGEHQGPPPLSPYTINARKAEGTSQEPNGFMSDEGDFAKSLEVVLRKSSRGAIGIAIEPRQDELASHSKKPGVRSHITNWDLVGMLCQTGLEVYAGEMEPDALMRLMAWRDGHFGSGEEDETPYYDPTGGPHGTGAWTTTGQFLERPEPVSGRAKRRLRQTRKEVLGRKGAKPVLFIPPRPLWTEEMEEKQNRIAVRATQEVLGACARVFSNTFGTMQWGPAAVARIASEIRNIHPGLAVGAKTPSGTIID